MRPRRFLVPVLGCAFLLNPAAAQKAQKPLSIVNVSLSQFEDGPNVPMSQGFVPGEAIFFSFQVTGYQREGEEDLSIRLSWKMEVRDAAGVPVIPPPGARIAAGVSREDKDWMPKVRHTIELPPFAEPGRYKIAIAVEDEVAKASASKETEFIVRGRAVEPGSALAVRNLNFYRGENDRDPALVPAYRPGDTVWIKFDIAGYKFADGNRFQVGYGITVLKPDGDATLNQPEAAVENGESFYPRRVLPAMLSLNLPKDVQTGAFTVIVTAADKIGDQRHEARATFTVEP